MCLGESHGSRGARGPVEACASPENCGSGSGTLTTPSATKQEPRHGSVAVGSAGGNQASRLSREAQAPPAHPTATYGISLLDRTISVSLATPVATPVRKFAEI